MNRVIIPTGYMGSGSSAITDLISEIEGFVAPNDSFEYVFLHCPDGFFDLEEKLTSLNNTNRSDEAIRRFLKQMKILYATPEKEYWIAGYKDKISYRFWHYVEEFLEDINMDTITGTWYYQQMPTVAYKVKLMEWRIKHKLGYKNYAIPSLYKDMKLAFPGKGEYVRATKQFLAKIYSDLGILNNNIILDQLILPHNMVKAKKYFSEDTLFYIVDRDPRDVFILNKYYWKETPIPYPTNVEDFCNIYRKIRESEIVVVADNIRRIHFEDLIYNYEESLSSIYSDLCVLPRQHTRKLQRFDPSISVNNTQVFTRCKTFIREAEYIQKNLEEYLYNFPYTIQHSKEEAF